MAEPTCSVGDCSRSVYAKALCGMHYQRQRTRGTVELLRAPTVEGRFWAKVDRADAAACWVWTGYRDRHGYGEFHKTVAPKQRKKIRAHRMAYELLVGPIPNDCELDHLCRNKACVNPSHLEPVTHAVNMRRYSESVTHCKYGHEYTPENTYLHPKGSRDCRACWQRERAERRKRQKVS